MLGPWETGEEQVPVVGRGSGGRPCPSAPASGPAAACSGLHLPAPRGLFFARQMCCCPGGVGESIDGWSLCALQPKCPSQAPPAGPVTEMGPGKGMQCLTCFTSQGHVFWGAGDWEPNPQLHLLARILVPFRMHSRRALGDS